MLLPLLNVWQQKHTLPHAQGVRVFSRKHVVWSLSCRSLSHRFPRPRHYKGVSFRSFATKATVLLGSPHSPGATQASPPFIPASPAPTGNVPVGAGEAGMKGGDVPGHFATRFVLCHSKPKSILPKLGVGTR